MIISREGINLFVKSAGWLLLKFTFNILLFGVIILSLLKYDNSHILRLIIILFYLIIVFIFNALINKNMLKKVLGEKSNRLFFFRKSLLKNKFGKAFDRYSYQKDNLMIFMFAILFFIIMNAVSIPFYLLIKNQNFIFLILIIVFFFTLFFTLNIISPLFFFLEYQKLRAKKDNEENT